MKAFRRVRVGERRGRGGKGRGGKWGWEGREGEGRERERKRISCAVGNLYNTFLQGDLLHCVWCYKG